jgi:hypothetical protein
MGRVSLPARILLTVANDCLAFHHVYALIVLMLVYLHQGEVKSQPKGTTRVLHNEQMRAATYSSQYKQQQQEQQQT